MTSDRQAEVGSHDTSVSWYQQDDPAITTDARRILEQYSGIAPDNVVPHVMDIRSKAWSIYPYPCIGSFRFIDLGIMSLPQYPQVLERIRTQNHVLLDVGCCFGQDLRKLAFDGAPSNNLIGSDLRDSFTDLGYDLFRDKNSFKARFLNGDFFADEQNYPLKPIIGSVDIVQASSFFHLFDWEEQVEVATRLVKLLKPQKGSMILGRQVGATEAMTLERPNGKRFRHNAKSWDEMWQEVGKLTKSTWRTEVLLEDMPPNTPIVEGVMWMKFVCWRE